VAQNIDKPQADRLKKLEIAKYEGLGYEYRHRPALS
jgi:hypothetical protein